MDSNLAYNVARQLSQASFQAIIVAISVGVDEVSLLFFDIAEKHHSSPICRHMG